MAAWSAAALIETGNRRARVAGDWLGRNQRILRRIQWGVVLFYVTLVAVPAVLPLPPATARLWSNLTTVAQFIFWGIWWPFVLVSMVLVGRVWCGVFCPEGSLSETASRFGRDLAVPRWVTWRGWPFVAFCLTTLYGQMISVYQYPRPALLILGGSTLAAIAVGLTWGRNKRVWCRYLCPVSGVFGLLSKLSPVHFRVDAEVWRASQETGERPEGYAVCAPLVPIRTMQSASGCHMCGRCSGMRGAVEMTLRAPGSEVVAVSGGANATNPWETMLILFGLMGIAVGAFHWPSSPWYVDIKQAIAGWLIDHDQLWPMERHAPWWLFSNYPERHDGFTLLDGGVLVLFILGMGAVMGGLLSLLGALGAALLDRRWSTPRFHHLVQAWIPLAGCGVFLGLSATTVSLLRGDGVTMSWVSPARMALLAGASLWSLWLAWRIGGRHAATAPVRRVAAMLPMTAGTAIAVGLWAMMFWG